MTLTSLDARRSVEQLRGNGVPFFDDVFSADQPLGPLGQAFTRNLIGPVAFEVTEKRGEHSSPEPGVRAMFASVERDQGRRGYL